MSARQKWWRRAIPPTNNPAGHGVCWLAARPENAFSPAHHLPPVIYDRRFPCPLPPPTPADVPRISSSRTLSPIPRGKATPADATTSSSSTARGTMTPASIPPTSPGTRPAWSGSAAPIRPRLSHRSSRTSSKPTTPWVRTVPRRSPITSAASATMTRTTQ